MISIIRRKLTDAVRWRSVLFVTLMVGTSISYARGTQKVNPEDYKVTAVKVEEGIKVDGRLNEACWGLASPATGFLQLEPEEGKPASERTEVWFLYDNLNLYIGIRCYDSHPDKIVANELRRDAELGHNDMVMILLDTFHDHRNCFCFCLNPLGTKQDGLITDEGKDKNFDWNGIWDCSAKIDSLGWTAEVAIPFKTLRFPSAEKQIWGTNIMRSIRRKNEVSFWTPMLRDYGINAEFKVSKIGQLMGLQGLKKGRNLQLKPYLLSGLERDYETGERERKFDTGLDIKYGITSDLTADITFNTDFAQVEADQEQINLSRFNLFFPEKREFFLEGAGTFYFGEKLKPWEDRPFISLFFSRRIGLAGETALPILWGVRVTGKASDYNLGLLTMAVDGAKIDDGGVKYIVPRTNFFALRLKKDIFERSSFGIILLDKNLNRTKSDWAEVNGDTNTYFHEDFVNTYNRTWGVDLSLSLLQSLNFGGFLAKTYTPDVQGKDWASNIYFDWRNDLFSFDGSYMEIGENFNPEMGFLVRKDVHRTKLELGYSPRPKLSLIRQSYFFFNNQFYTDWENTLLTRKSSLGVYNALESGGHLMIGFNQGYEKLTEEDEFEIREGKLIEAGKYTSLGFFSEFGSDPGRMFSVRCELNSDGLFDGKILEFGVGESFRPNQNLSLSSSLSRNWVRDLSVLDLTHNQKRKIGFNTTLIAARINYSFSANLFSRAFLQYNSDAEEFSANLLFNYIYRPGSSLYLVYNETRGDRLRSGVKNRVIILKIAHLLSI